MENLKKISGFKVRLFFCSFHDLSPQWDKRADGREAGDGM
jgi:hypothetical protein